MDSRSVALAMLALVACAGPEPEVTNVVVADAAPAGHVRVEIEVANRSSGHGEATLEVSLVNRDSGVEIVAERTLELAGHQRVHLTADIPAPLGTYEARVRARYPD